MNLIFVLFMYLYCSLHFLNDLIFWLINNNQEQIYVFLPIPMNNFNQALIKQNQTYINNLIKFYHIYKKHQNHNKISPQKTRLQSNNFILYMEWECPICCQIQPISYQISECQHRFCLNCCVYHVSEKSNTFNQILCPHVDCKKPFNKNPKIMNILPAKVLENIKSRERFMFISSNPHIKPCSVINCQGVIDMKQTKKLCDLCNTPHCPKCQKAFHQGPCLLNQQDKQMKVNGFQKCPHCSIWVQKKQGCNYVDCKCGTNFCYVCGVSFNDDPCRLKQKWDHQLEIRRTIKKMQLKLPQQKADIPKYIIKFPFKLIFFILYTLLLCLTGNLLLIIAISLLCVLSPVMVIAASCSFPQKYMKILAIIFLPFLSAILIILIILIFTLYPLLRKTSHHGVYDGFDLAMNTGIKIYLKGLSCIF